MIEFVDENILLFQEWMILNVIKFTVGRQSFKTGEWFLRLGFPENLFERKPQRPTRDTERPGFPYVYNERVH